MGVVRRLIVMFATLVVFGAAAPGSGRVAVLTHRCSPSFDAAVRSMISLELKAPVLENFTVGDTLVDLRCDGPTTEVLVDAPAKGRLQRDVVSDLPASAMPRAIALVVAESVAQLWSAPEPVAEPVPPPRVVAPMESEREPPRWLVGALATTRFGGVTTFGGGARAGVRLIRHLGLHLDATGSAGSVRRDGGVVYASLFDAGLTLDWRLETARWLLRLGAGARVGLGRLVGQPTGERVGGSVQGVLWGPFASSSIEWRALGWLGLALGGELGLWAPRLEGLVFDEQPVHFTGPFGALWLSVAFHGWP